MHNGHVIHRTRRVNLANPIVSWKPHGSGSSLLERKGLLPMLLPRLQSVVDDAVPVPLHDSYAAQRERRVRGGSYALWQMAEAGAVTLPQPALGRGRPVMVSSSYYVSG